MHFTRIHLTSKSPTLVVAASFHPVNSRVTFFNLTVLAKKAALYGVMRLQIKITNMQKADELEG